MFIHVAKDFAVSLEAREDFKHFNLVVDAPKGDAKLAPALSGVATLDPEGHAWVSEVITGAAPDRNDIRSFCDILDLDDYVSFGGKG